MDNESRAAKEDVIRAVEAEIKGSLVTGWIYLGGAVLLAAIGTSTYEVRRASNPTGWIQLIVELPIAVFVLGVSFTAWRFATRRQRLWVQLQEMMAQETAGAQPGVWPPPPSKPSRR